MTNTPAYRIGFACKYMHPDRTLSKRELESVERPRNTRTTTVAWCNRQDPKTAELRILDIIEHNITSVLNQLKYVATLPAPLRMMRISSDLLPFYTQDDWRYMYGCADLVAYFERRFGEVGQFARDNDIRVSFHPGQFTVLASDNPDIVERSIQEFEYHVDMLRWMGYGRTFQDAKCNVHISGRQGPDGIKAVLPRLSAEARNVITIENDEMCHGLDASMELVDDVALVLDIHHHWVRTGEYIQVDDDRVKRVLDSWRGVRPTMHYSLSREDLLEDHCQDTMPDMEELLAAGYKKQKLRAHSDYMWNRASNEWAATFLEHFDIMVESKAKNLASIAFYEQIRDKDCV
jgi:UV DNA damage repair endonuclease